MTSHTEPREQTYTQMLIITHAHDDLNCVSASAAVSMLLALAVDRLRFQKQSFVLVFVMFPVTAVHIKKTLVSVSSFASIAWSKT